MIFSAPLYRNSVSPFFDNARLLLCIHISGTQELYRVVKDLSTLNTIEKAIFLKKLKPNIMVCNAISLFWHNYFISNNIEIYPLIYGDIDEVFNRYINKKLEKHTFS